MLEVFPRLAMPINKHAISWASVRLSIDLFVRVFLFKFHGILLVFLTVAMQIQLVFANNKCVYLLIANFCFLGFLRLSIYRHKSYCFPFLIDLLRNTLFESCGNAVPIAGWPDRQNQLNGKAKK